MPAATTPPIVLVTGAGRRIGRAIALNFASRGWSVGVHYHQSADAAEAVAREIMRGGGKSVALPADLADAASLAKLIPACIDKLGAPTCLINCASLFLEDTIATVTVAQWDRHISVNLRAPVFLAQSFAALLPAVADGTIINIIDQRVWKPTPEFLSYSVSKSALWQTTRMLAQGLAPRIRVNAIAPGPVLQSIHQTAEQFADEQLATPLGRGTTPAEIAKTIHFILETPAMTGQMIALDGGQHLAWQAPDVAAKPDSRSKR